MTDPSRPEGQKTPYNERGMGTGYNPAVTKTLANGSTKTWRSWGRGTRSVKNKRPVSGSYSRLRRLMFIPQTGAARITLDKAQI